MNEDYIRLLFKKLPFDYVLDYIFSIERVIIYNYINKITDEKTNNNL